MCVCVCVSSAYIVRQRFVCVHKTFENTLFQGVFMRNTLPHRLGRTEIGVERDPLHKHTQREMQQATVIYLMLSLIHI